MLLMLLLFVVVGCVVFVVCCCFFVSLFVYYYFLIVDCYCFYRSARGGAFEETYKTMPDLVGKGGRDGIVRRMIINK